MFDLFDFLNWSPEEMLVFIGAVLAACAFLGGVLFGFSYLL